MSTTSLRVLDRKVFISRMATGQDIVTCDICKREPLQHFCNGCEIRLCNNCVVPHLGSGSVEGHFIVQYKYRDARKIQPKVCLKHPSMIKTLFCKECPDTICVRCIDEHREHDIIDLKQFVDSQYRLIEESSEYLRNELFPNCTKCIESIKLLLAEANTLFDQERKRILDAGGDRRVNEKRAILLIEMEKQKNETISKLQDIMKSYESTLQDIDHNKDMCETAKSSLDDMLKFAFDKNSFDMKHTAVLSFPKFETPTNSSFEIGSLKSIKKNIRMPLGGNQSDENQILTFRLRKMTEEVEELYSRLKRVDNQFTDDNPINGDLSDVHNPTRLGKMYIQLFENEWSEAFEALKPTTKEDEDEIYPNTLTLLQKIVKGVFSFCKEKSQEQLQKLENHIIEALKQDTAQNPETKSVNEEENMDVDVKPDEGGDGKVESRESREKPKSPLHQVVERHAKEIRKAASKETAKQETQVFIQQKLSELLPDEWTRQDERVVTYVSKCVELCWYMCMQDPPMELVFPQKGDTMDKNLFSHHGRKGKVVDICVWAALLLHKEGPVVCKGYVLPEEKK